MNRSAPRSDLLLYTTGYGNHTLDRFLEILSRNHIECVVDVRSVPYSSYQRDFSRENLNYEFRQHGIRYIWLGDKLGGNKDQYRNSAGFRLDDQYNDDPNYRSGISDLMNVASRHRTAVMCAEEDPRSCHRHKIIANTLVRHRIPECNDRASVTVLHIRGNGELEDASQVLVPVQTAFPI